MRFLFLFVFSKFCPAGLIVFPAIQLPSDPISRRTPLPSSNTSYHQAIAMAGVHAERLRMIYHSPSLINYYGYYINAINVIYIMIFIDSGNVHQKNLPLNDILEDIIISMFDIWETTPLIFVSFLLHLLFLFVYDIFCQWFY